VLNLFTNLGTLIDEATVVEKEVH